MKNLFIFLALTILLSACEQQASAPELTQTAPEPATTVVQQQASAQQDFASLIKKAEDLFSQTQAVGHSWSINLDRLKDARQAAEDGDMVKAGTNAEEAIMLSELALIQAEVEKGRWQSRVPK